MSNQQPTSKRPKLASAFSKTPMPRAEESQSSASTTVAVTKTAVYTLPPTNTKHSGIPVAMLKAQDAEGSVITISQEKKPSFTFGSPTIGDKSVGGFAFAGYGLVKGGDSAPPTGSFGYAADARPTYVFRSGKLYPDRSKLSKTTVDANITVPMSDLGDGWGDTKIPTITLASNTYAFFEMPSFQEAKNEAAGKIDIGAADAVLLTTADNPKRLDTEKVIVTSPLPYLAYLSKYLMLLNPPPGGRYGATVIDVLETASRPLKLTLQHAAKKSRTVVVELWSSTLTEAGIDVDALRSIPVIAYIHASLDAWSGETKLMVVALAAPPPDQAKYIAFSKSSALKSHFNGLGHNAEEAKGRECCLDQLLMNEGRAVSLKYARAGVANTLLIWKPAAAALIKSHAAAMAREQANDSTSGVLAIVNELDDETITNSLEVIEKITGGYATVESLMGAINARMDDAVDDAQHASMVSAATFLHALLAGGKAAVDPLCPLVYGYKSARDATEDDDEESDFEDGGDDDDLYGNL